MGWWSSDILGGDAPLDCLSSFGRAFGVGQEGTWTSDLPNIKTALDSASETALLDFINHSYEPDIAAQVVAILCLRSGSHMYDSIKRLAMQACYEEDVLGWSDPSERAAKLLWFTTRLACYRPGVPFDELR